MSATTIIKTMTEQNQPDMSSSSMYISAVLLVVVCRFSLDEVNVAGVKPGGEPDILGTKFKNFP